MTALPGREREPHRSASIRRDFDAGRIAAREPDLPLTTGQVARFCGVAPRTVSKWFDSGQLPGFRIPGSQDRRIPRAAFRAFLTAHSIPDDAFQHFESTEISEVSTPDSTPGATLG